MPHLGFTCQKSYNCQNTIVPGSHLTSFSALVEVLMNIEHHLGGETTVRTCQTHQLSHITVIVVSPQSKSSTLQGVGVVPATQKETQLNIC